MIRRSRRTVPATLTALVLLAVGALVAATAIQVLLGRTPVLPVSTIGSALGSVSWGSWPVLAAAVVLAVLGLVLLVAALWPGRSHVLPLRPAAAPGPDDEVGVPVAEAGLHRTALSRLVRSTADGIDGVQRVRVVSRRTRVRVDATTVYHDPAPTRAAIHDALTTRLGRLGLVRVPSVRVRVTARKEAS